MDIDFFFVKYKTFLMARTLTLSITYIVVMFTVFKYINFLTSYFCLTLNLKIYSFVSLWWVNEMTNEKGI